jgi:hypothetical protein
MDFARVLRLVDGDTATRILGSLVMKPGPEGGEIPVPRAEHLAALKIFGVKNEPRRAMQDLEHIRRILELPGVDADEIRGYFTRYGLEALLDRIE